MEAARLKYSKFQSSDEDRFLGIGESKNNRPLFIVFVIRDKKIRVISARRMHLKERLSYEKIKQKNK